ncbi:ADP-ribosylglycohydrolase family protein [Maribacter sp. 2307ULW6-5]|uniref:ADP-ribosylglycohydrolase family protein n=1 Tax=Maribacter sp. 2307ULW6-5 TaxID=3386275 RepID=UPI0039BCB9D2
MSKTISLKAFKNKIRGCWVGKCAGGILGAPIEGYKVFNDIEINNALFENNFANDDLDLQLLWLDMALKKGPKIREHDYLEHWKNHVAFPWNEYGIATRNIRIGLDNPDTGKHDNGYWKHSMGSPIRSEIWGLLCAGNPEQAAFYAKMDSTLDHEGFSVHAEQYLAASMALAFVETDVNSILTKALAHIPKESTCSRLVRSVIFWNREYGADVAKGKIKSLYGDADFTSAPMNIGFTILSLLNSANDMDMLSTALHFGHDSDCIVATAAALLGAVVGFDAVPTIWKERVGNEILVSPEISGIYCPKTITELTELTCEAAQSFLSQNEKMTIQDTSHQKPKTSYEQHMPYHLNTTVTKFPNINSYTQGRMQISVENLETEALELDINLTSSYFEPQRHKISIKGLKTGQFDFDLIPKYKVQGDRPSLSYELEVVGADTFVFKKGVPNYGKWLLLGPFMEDDRELVPMDAQFPDHGMGSLPSVQYMNHDKSRPGSNFITPEQLQNVPSLSELEKWSCGVQTLLPDAMEMNLGNYFYGKGERTLYLYTHINAPDAQKKWLCLGHSNYSMVWLNQSKLGETKTARRRWPGTEYLELPLTKGQNDLLVRLDITNDDFVLHIGLKEHLGKHPHQSQWDTDLLFNIDH